MAFNDENLSKTLDGFGLNNQNRTAAEDAKIEYSNGQGYHVTPEKDGNQLDVAKVKELIVSQVQSGNTSVEINSAYQAPKSRVTILRLPKSWIKLTRSRIPRLPWLSQARKKCS